MPSQWKRRQRYLARRCLVMLGSLVFAGVQQGCVPNAANSADSSDRPLATGRIIVHSSRQLGEISPLIYGVGIEWTDDGNRIFDPGRGALRQEVLDALKPLHIPVIRFPGGILADYYEWRDGVGPRGRRPHRSNQLRF